MLMVVVRESKASTGELMHSAVPFHLFSCVCPVEFLSPISAVVQRHTHMHHFSPRLWSLNFPLGSSGKNGGDRHLSNHHGNTALEIASPTPRQRQSTIISPL